MDKGCWALLIKWIPILWQVTAAGSWLAECHHHMTTSGENIKQLACAWLSTVAGSHGYQRDKRWVVICWAADHVATYSVMGTPAVVVAGWRWVVLLARLKWASDEEGGRRRRTDSCLMPLRPSRCLCQQTSYSYDHISWCLCQQKSHSHDCDAFVTKLMSLLTNRSQSWLWCPYY